LQATSGIWGIFTIQIGNHYGDYDILAHHGPLTFTELASRTGTHERYVREWLEQQTVTGILAVDNPAAAVARRECALETVYARCCGLDSHKKSIVACLSLPGATGAALTTVRTFGAMTADILALSDWLTAAGCTHVAMESTGVFWKPVWNLLEGLFTLLLVNPRHMKAVPGRKTDVTDAEWIANLLRHGLLTGSYVPERSQQELRELTRYRTTLVRERTAEANRLQKTLEGANIKLASVSTDILGLSGRQILAALVAGATDAAAMAECAHGRLREKLPALTQALVGRFGAHQRFMVAQQLAHVDFLDAAIAQVSAEIGARLQPVGDLVARLNTIPWGSGGMLPRR
jgi:transposase